MLRNFPSSISRSLINPVVDEMLATNATKKPLKISTHDLAFTGSLLETGSRQHLQALQRFVKQVSDAATSGEEMQVGLIMQQAPMTDNSAAWKHELRDEILLDELVLRMLEVRKLFFEILNSNAYFVYVFDDHCLGGFFELALCCYKRICFNAKANVGFAVTGARALPYGGSLARDAIRSTRPELEWQNRPLIDTEYAFSVGLIDFVFNTDHWREDAVRWVEHNVLRQEIYNKPSIKENLLPFKFAVEPIDVLLKQYSETLDNFSKKNSTTQAWDFLWANGKLKPKNLKPSEYEFYQLYLIAQNMLSKRFLVWSDGAADFIISGRSDKTAVSYVDECVYIDLTFFAPPTKAIVKLFDAGFHIIFCGADAESLREFLSLIYSRLQKVMPSAELQATWETSVAWFVGDLEGTSHYVIRWAVDDRIEISYKTQNLELLRFLGSRDYSERGWCEITNVKLNDETTALNASLLNIGYLIADGLIDTKALANRRVRLSVFIRSYFLYEMILVSRRIKGGLARVCESLQETGWGFIAEDSFWEHFLRARQESFEVSASEVALGDLSIPEDVWRLGIWKEAKELTYQQSDEQDLWSPTLVNHHFAYVAGLLAEFIFRGGLIKTEHEANIFIQQALSYPANLGAPMSFIKERGSHRAIRYINKYWPQVKATELC
jgi:hypothetical protein